MITAVFEAMRIDVEQYALQHLPDARFHEAGRLTAVQSPKLEELGEVAIREIAEAYNLPLRGVVDRPPFVGGAARSNIAAQVFLALPPARPQRSRG